MKQKSQQQINQQSPYHKFNPPLKPGQNFSDPKIIPWKFQQNQKFTPSKIQYGQLHQFGRPYNAVVSLTGGKGSFKDIQAAIVAVNNLGGGTVFLKIGTYILSNQLTLFKNVQILGEDFFNTIIDCGTANNQILISGISNCSIKNLTIQNGRSAGGTIYITNSQSITLNNIYLLNNTANDGSGVDIFVDNIGGPASMVKIAFCWSKSGGNPLYLRGNGISTWIMENRFETPLGIAINADLTSPGSGYVENNEFLDCPVQLMYGKFQFSRIIGNVSYFSSQLSTNFQIDFRTNSQNILFSNNHMSAGGNGGVRVSGGNIMEIANNNIASGGSASALELDNGGQIQAGNNQILAGGTNGFGVLIDNTFSSQVTGNYIQSKAQGYDAIRIQNGANNIQVTGNMAWSSGTVNTAYGINILGTACYSNIVTGNRLIGNNGGTADTGTGDIFTGNLAN